ncbi:MAG TPA: DUF6457 domain-containing protein [Actinomycetota bacterium]|jgi:Domain of unknown function (DUF6457)
METWIDGLASALGQDPASAAETSQVLTVARDVAHGVERKITPVSTYLLGIAVGRRMAAGSNRSDALTASIAELRSVLPETPEDEEAPGG